MEEHENWTSLDYQCLAEFRYQLRSFLAFSEQTVRAVGLEPQQHQLLLGLRALSLRGKVTISDLAEWLKIQHHSAVELVKRMVERDLIQRTRDEEDQRCILITLTPAGEEILRKLSLFHRAELRSTGPALVRALQAIISDADTPSSAEGLSSQEEPGQA